MIHFASHDDREASSAASVLVSHLAVGLHRIASKANAEWRRQPDGFYREASFINVGCSDI